MAAHVWSVTPASILAHTSSFFTHLSCSRSWIDPRLDGSVEAIEAKAQDAAAEAFRRAQAQEQKDRRSRTKPSNIDLADRPAQTSMSAKNADRYAGKYAVCLRLSEGGLLRIGALIDRPEELPAEMAQLRYKELLEAGQQLAIGICDRTLRRWVEPVFLAQRFSRPKSEQPASPRKAPARRQRKAVSEKLSPARKPTAQVDTSEP